MAIAEIDPMTEPSKPRGRPRKGDHPCAYEGCKFAARHGHKYCARHEDWVRRRMVKDGYLREDAMPTQRERESWL